MRRMLDLGVDAIITDWPGPPESAAGLTGGAIMTALTRPLGFTAAFLHAPRRGGDRRQPRPEQAQLRRHAQPPRSRARLPGTGLPRQSQGREILGLPCYPDIAAVPDPVELAVLIVPAALVAGTVEACGQRGLKAAVVISGGFREIGPEGAAREREMVEIARRYGMRVMGPNGIGVIDTHTPLNTTFVKGMPRRGHIAFLSQSGALCGGIIDWALDARYWLQPLSERRQRGRRQ